MTFKIMSMDKKKKKPNGTTASEIHGTPSNALVEALLSSVEGVVQRPGSFLGPAKKETEQSRYNSKLLYDHSCSIGNDIATDTEFKTPVLDELYITGFDSEQIWQQIDHRFNVVTDESYIGELSKLLTDSSIGLDLNTTQSNGTAESDESDEGDDEDLEGEEDDISDQSEDEDMLLDDDDYNGIDEEEDDEESGDNEVSISKKDKFFSLKQMEAFMKHQDDELMRDPDKFERMPELYESDGDDAEEHNYMFKDLYGDGKDIKSTLPNQNSSLQAKLKALSQESHPEYDEAEEEEEEESDEEIILGGTAGDDEDISDDELELMKALDEETGVVQDDSAEEQGEEEEKAESEAASEENMSEEEAMDEDGLEEGSASEDGSDGEHLEDVLGQQKNEPAKSEYEKRADKLKERIAAMEEEALTGDKPWQLKGEVTARTRPENSFLQEDVEFDSNVAPVPAITVETTQTLESLIIQRIKDKAFDDVVRKTRLKEDGERFQKRIVLDHEKSKMSLSQIYEQEYVKLRDHDENEDEDKEDPAEIEIKKMMTSLFTKLEALSSFQYTPKPAAKEVQIISSLPALTVEEVQPDTVADSARLAPEEVKKPKVDVKDRSEMDATDKNRIRRTKKAKIRKNEALKKKIEQRVKKLAPGMGNKRAEQRSIEAIKQAVVNDGKIIKPTKDSVISEKTYSSSKEFFKALQNEVKLDKKVTKKKLDAKKWVGAKSAEKLKL